MINVQQMKSDNLFACPIRVVKSLLLVLILLGMGSNYSRGQNLDQFYYSTFEPDELNISSADRIKKYYDNYLKNGENDSLDEKLFVYQNNYFLDQLNRSGSVFYGDEISAYLNRLKDWILEDTQLEGEFKIYLTNYPTLNAFTNDFGNIYVNITSLAKLENEEELLFLLAHEISHGLLEHTYKSELYNQSISSEEWEQDVNSANFKTHAFSRKSELEADSLALSLLKNKVPLSSDISLLEKLKHSNNPVFSGEIDMSLLIDSTTSSYESMRSYWEELNIEIKHTEEVVSDSFLTHPSIEARIQSLNENSLSIINQVSYQATGEFNYMKGLASLVLVSSYMEYKMYTEALDLILKLRKNQSDNEFLIETQVKVMVLLSQQKYRDEIEDKLLNLYGASSNDSDFLKFRYFIFSISNLDFSIMTLNFIRSNSIDFIKSNSVLYKRPYDYCYQQLIRQHTNLIATDSLDRKYYSYEVDSTVEETPEKASIYALLDSLLDSDFTYIFYNDSSYLVNYFAEDNTIDPYHETLISGLASGEEKVESGAIPSNELTILIHPNRATKYFRRGKFNKSSSFDPNAKAILFENYCYYLNSENRQDFNIDYEKTVELESEIERIQKDYTHYYNSDSLGVNKQITVKENYISKIIQIWMDDQLEGQNYVYSRVDEQFQEFVVANNIDYLVFTACIVNDNKGLGRRNNLNYYEVYFDIKNGGIAYISKIGSKYKPTKYQLEQLVYLSNYKKRS
jgi:hypothetical protein